MATLNISTNLCSIVVVGEFCGWDVDKAIRCDKKDGCTLIRIENMLEGEYRILSCKSYHGGEVYPTDGRQMSNRYFNGNKNETIYCYFERKN